MKKRNTRHEVNGLNNSDEQPATKNVSLSRKRRAKPGRRLVALSSAAIISVYALGYARTQGTESAFDSLSSLSPQPSPTATAAPTAASASSVAPKESGTLYADGSYTGVGTSRHGNIEVTVVIKNGKIDSASVSRCSTRYPCSDVNPLVRAVITTQSVPVDHVSGATDSSNAYKQAVAQALAKAV